jgi:hypothetical protein
MVLLVIDIKNISDSLEVIICITSPGIKSKSLNLNGTCTISWLVFGIPENKRSFFTQLLDSTHVDPKDDK